MGLKARYTRSHIHHPIGLTTGALVPIKFACPSCGKAYNVKDELAGKKAKCKCGNAISIPAVAAAPAPSPLDSDPLFSDDPFGGDLFSDVPSAGAATSSGDSLFDEEFPMGGPLPATPVPNSASPYQSAGQPAGPVAQTAGGYAVSVPTVGSIESSEAEEAPMGGGIAFLIGVGLSGAGAMLGAAVWAVITIVTGYEIVWIAWGVGFTSGFGMAIAHNLSDGIDDFFGGLIASIMAILGIVAGKFAVYLLIVMSEAEEGFTFGMMFDPLDLLFFGLAVATAYKLGSGGGDDD